MAPAPPLRLKIDEWFGGVLSASSTDAQFAEFDVKTMAFTRSFTNKGAGKRKSAGPGSSTEWPIALV